jgi:hypothetical protein
MSRRPGIFVRALLDTSNIILGCSMVSSGFSLGFLSSLWTTRLLITGVQVWRGLDAFGIPANFVITVQVRRDSFVRGCVGVVVLYS